MGIDKLRTTLADRYRIGRELGAGGMATVYLAEDLRHRRQVAIKVLHAELSALLGPERFLKEIELTASLQHPHILPLFDSGSAGELLYYVMPFVEGETLRDRLSREKQLPVADAVRIATEIADALDYAHKRGVVHRDIKPENILVQNGHALVVDFGIAIAVQQAGGERMTQTGLSLGTPQYMSPEQAMGERDISAASDVYALGCVTYEMLAGEPPFTGATAQAIVARIVTEQPRPLTAQRSSVQPNVAAAVHTALEKLPADRFATAGAFAAALADPGYRGPGVVTQPVNASYWKPLALAASVIAVLGIAGAVWQGTRNEQTTPPVSTWRNVIAFPDSGSPRFNTEVSHIIGISPDGNTLAWPSGNFPDGGLRVLDATALESRAIEGGDRAYIAPTFSPDSKRMAFFTYNTLIVMRPDGSGMKTVLDSLTRQDLIAWLDDQHLVFEDDSGLVIVSVDGGKRERLTTVNREAGEARHTSPIAVPGTGQIVFTLRPLGQNGTQSAESVRRSSIAVVERGAGSHKVLTPGIRAWYVDPGFLLIQQSSSVNLLAQRFDAGRQRLVGDPIQLSGFSPPGNLLDVSASGRMIYLANPGMARRSTLARVGIDGASVPLDSGTQGNITAVSVSHDGRFVAATYGIYDPVEVLSDKLQVRNLHSGAVTSVVEQGESQRFPSFVGNGESIIFTNTSSEPGIIYQADIGRATQPRVLVQLPGLMFDPAISSDGRTLYYSRRAANDANIYTHDMDRPDAADQPLIATAEGEYAPRPSPDGRWLAYQSGNGGIDEVYVRSTDPTRTERWKISRKGGKSPRWSPEGNRLYYLTLDSLEFVTVTSGDGFTASQPRALFSTRRFRTDLRGTYDVLPGNAGFIMIEQSTPTKSANEIVMIDDWRSLLPDSARRLK